MSHIRPQTPFYPFFTCFVHSNFQMARIYTKQHALANSLGREMRVLAPHVPSPGRPSCLAFSRRSGCAQGLSCEVSAPSGRCGELHEGCTCCRPCRDCSCIARDFLCSRKEAFAMTCSTNSTASGVPCSSSVLPFNLSVTRRQCDKPSVARSDEKVAPFLPMTSPMASAGTKSVVLFSATVIIVKKLVRSKVSQERVLTL